MALTNIEALAEPEGTQCPNPTDVPDRYIVTSGPKSVTYQTNSSGQINIGGVIYAGYAKNTSVTLTVETFNCSGSQKGACCDQSSVGTRPV